MGPTFLQDEHMTLDKVSLGRRKASNCSVNRQSGNRFNMNYFQTIHRGKKGDQYLICRESICYLQKTCSRWLTTKTIKIEEAHKNQISQQKLVNKSNGRILHYHNEITIFGFQQGQTNVLTIFHLQFTYTANEPLLIYLFI